MARTSSSIERITVTSAMPFIVYGSVRGLVSEHRTERAAWESLRRDRIDCGRHNSGGYSDADVYSAIGGEWVPCEGADSDE